MSQKIIDLKAQRAALVAKMQAIQDKADAEKRDFTADETTSYENLDKEFSSKSKELQRVESLAAANDAIRAQRDENRERRQGGGSGDKKVKAHATDEYREAFFGAGGFVRNQGRVSSIKADILNVLQTGTDADGGFLVPEEFESTIIRLLRNEDPMRANATVITSTTDKNLSFQASGAAFGWIGENGAFPQADPKVGRIVLKDHKLGGFIVVSEELLQDSGSDIESFVQGVTVEGIADLENEAYTAGDGAAKPFGLFSTVKVGTTTLTEVTGAVSATPAITGDNLIDTYHALPRAYRARASWQASDTLVKMIRKLKDTTGQYIWQPGLTADRPDTILGRPVVLSDYVPSPAVAGRSLGFGDLKKYYIVDRLGIGFRRLDEIGALNGQVYFRVVKRTDGTLIDGRAQVFFKHGAAA